VHSKLLVCCRCVLLKWNCTSVKMLFSTLVVSRQLIYTCECQQQFTLQFFCLASYFAWQFSKGICNCWWEDFICKVKNCHHKFLVCCHFLYLKLSSGCKQYAGDVWFRCHELRNRNRVWNECQGAPCCIRTCCLCRGKLALVFFYNKRWISTVIMMFM
jgi:hypothetical protein